MFIQKSLNWMNIRAWCWEANSTENGAHAWETRVKSAYINILNESRRNSMALRHAETLKLDAFCIRCLVVHHILLFLLKNFSEMRWKRESEKMCTEYYHTIRRKPFELTSQTISQSVEPFIPDESAIPTPTPPTTTKIKYANIPHYLLLHYYHVYIWVQVRSRPSSGSSSALGCSNLHAGNF